MKINQNLTFNNSEGIFIGSQTNCKDCKIGIYGVPYDGTTSFRPGTRFGPSAIRNISNGIESFCPQLNLDLEDLKYVDLGSLDIPFGAPEKVINLVKQATILLMQKGIKPLLLGGEHSITEGAIAGIVDFHPELIILQLDAHADLRDEWLGSKHNHACVMRRCIEILPSKKIFQMGIRSGTSKEFKELKEKKRLISHQSGQVAKSLDKAMQPYLGMPIYLTLDLDWFDPSVMPGTGTPEPGGFLWQDFAAVIEVIKKHNLIAADIVELAPKLDHSEISSILAAKIARSLIMLLSLEK
ncbi:agmatinase [Prochlorococcus marinus]|uniref:Arginase family n=1 Tax=Prochlorococcus marinus (strain MIT 9211) TaxID=93059 RepID=A9BDD5_PROM4|nr:agmatinase [Prochlorococcus marinus]ABX09748.1 Arginase family [Prochlorococcus marinus str. MIT 9211]